MGNLSHYYGCIARISFARRTSPVTSSKPEAVSAESVTSTGAIALADLLRKNAEPEPVVAARALPAGSVREVGGRSDGPEPPRYGDWEKKDRKSTRLHSSN